MLLKFHLTQGDGLRAGVLVSFAHHGEVREIVIDLDGHRFLNAFGALLGAPAARFDPLATLPERAAGFGYLDSIEIKLEAGEGFSVHFRRFERDFGLRLVQSHPLAVRDQGPLEITRREQFKLRRRGLKDERSGGGAGNANRRFSTGRPCRGLGLAA